jgi:6-phosphogluconolactonase (cycloisomerase 2 family)
MMSGVNRDLVHIGCYTAASGGAGEGITLARRDPTNGALTLLGVAAVTDSPSFLCRHPDLPVLYAANESDEGAVSAFAVADDGTLDPLGSRPTGGIHPCHVAVSPDGRHLASTNYDSGSFAVHPLARDGALGERADLVAHDGRGPHPERQEAPHAHQASWDSDGHLRVVDLGVDAVFRYAVEHGRTRLAGEPLRTPPGTGPRHLARGPGGWLYVAGELSAAVLAYEVDPATGAATERARVAASERSGLVQPSEIAVDPAGRFLYVANRGVDTIAVFALVDGLPRYLTEVPTGGRWPRHFVLWDDFLYVANERSHSVVAFEITGTTGVPVATGVILEVASPTCLTPPAVLVM